MMGIRGFKTKKELKAAVGQDISKNIVETSVFGKEFKPSGINFFVGPDIHTRKWYAQVQCKDGKIISVK